MKKLTILANTFSTVLHEWLTVEQMETVVKLNNANKNSGVCHTHDYCDANMAMDEAFVRVFGKNCSTRNQKDMSKFSAAWTIASDNDFKQIA